MVDALKIVREYRGSCLMMASRLKEGQIDRRNYVDAAYVAREIENRIKEAMKTMSNDTPKTVDSTSDQRTTNNVMRHEYRVLTQDEKDQMKLLKDKGLEFIQCVDLVANASGGMSRELALAKTKIEEAVFWAVKHVTRDL